MPTFVIKDKLGCCERCGVPTECTELRTRWFCTICREDIRDWIAHYQILTEQFLASVGLM